MLWFTWFTCRGSNSVFIYPSESPPSPPRPASSPPLFRLFQEAEAFAASPRADQQRHLRPPESAVDGGWGGLPRGPGSSGGEQRYVRVPRQGDEDVEGNELEVTSIVDGVNFKGCISDWDEA